MAKQIKEFLINAALVAIFMLSAVMAPMEEADKSQPAVAQQNP